MNKLLLVTSGLLAAGSVLGEFSLPTLNVDAKVEFNTAGVYEGRRRLDQNFAPDIEIGAPLLEDAANLYVGVGAGLGVGNSHSSARNEVAPRVGFSYDFTDLFTVDFGYTLHNFGKKPLIGVVGSDGDSYFNRNFAALNAAGSITTSRGDIAPDAFADGIHSVLTNSASGLDFAKGVSNEGVLSIARDTANGLQVQYNFEGKKRFHEIYAGIMADVLLNPALYFSYDFTQKKSNINGAVHY
ncbi:MAG: hypothetical protein LBR92_01010, partial [Puniceicoccales bacterium]|nr:hypothetical protein [Puniceicoccales bacterium]